MFFDPFLTLGYVGKVKVFLHPINAVPYMSMDMDNLIALILKVWMIMQRQKGKLSWSAERCCVAVDSASR